MTRFFLKELVWLAVAAVALVPGPSSAASPTAEQALKLTPIQPGVDYDRPSPEEAAKCKILPGKFDGHVGWIVEGPERRDLAEIRRHQRRQHRRSVELLQGRLGGLSRHRLELQRQGRPIPLVPHRRQPLGNQHQGGRNHRLLEVDLGRRGHGRGDCGHRHARRRSLRTAGARAGRVEVAGTGQSACGERGREDRKRPSPASRRCRSRQKAVGPDAVWVQLSASRPGVVPAGTDGSTKDLRVYENAVAIVESGGKHGQVQIGTLGPSGRCVAGDRPAPDRRRGAGRRDAFGVLLPGRDGPARRDGRQRRQRGRAKTAGRLGEASTARRPRRPRPRSRPA